MEKVKNYIIISLFSLLLLGFAILGIFLPDKRLSESERRVLAQAPELTFESFFSGEFSDDLESYLLDQFPMREGFRTLNALTRLYIFRQQDVNGLWTEDGAIYKEEYPLNENQIKYGAELINRLHDTYLKGMDVYYSIIPDKSYFAAEDSGHLSMDYAKLVELLRESVSGPEYIDIFGCLALEDYYRTDTHWRQDHLFDVVETIGSAMGVGEYITPQGEYTSHELYPFKGVYLGQSALPIEPDTITYLTSPYTQGATVTGIDLNGQESVYMLDRFEGLDGYDVFLGGAQSLLTIECPNAKTDRELIIFRDSFGSSISPLFLGAYSKITLIDLRYINSTLLEDYVTFANQDVLFLYSTTILNSSMLMR